jgi:foldase protein PrsA
LFPGLEETSTTTYGFGRDLAMIAQERGREARWFGKLLLLVVIASAYPVRAQQDAAGRYPVAPPAPGAGEGPPVAKPKGKVRLSDIKVPPLTIKAIPVNPGDPVAQVNGQIISRQQLADECVAREGKKILELLINRTLIEQALTARKLEVTGAEIDREIDSVAANFGISREKWLMALEKEKGISPTQYARDLVYPALVLRKLSSGRVQVTPKDMQDAFEAQYGDKIRCRMIMVEKQNTALEVWEELKKNPAGFEKIAQERSTDPGTRGLGGLLAQPITRHAYPQTLSDAVFQQIVDGDPKDRDPSHKPKDGDITGVIQYGEAGFVILRRESLIPGAKGISLNDERVRKQTYDAIYQVKLNEAMGVVFQELMKAAEIENMLTGTIKMAHEEKHPDFRVDGNVELMSRGQGAGPANPRAGAGAAGADTLPRTKLPPPAALSPDAVKQFDSIQQRSSSSSQSSAGSSPPGAPN